jgi:hypothetical protein
MKRTLAVVLARLVEARLNCLKSEKHEDWLDKHEERIETLVKDMMPNGSSVDHGTTIDHDRSTGERLVFTFDYHHMDEYGGYDGWTSHTLTVKASLAHGLTLKISGPDRNQIKEYLHDTYYCALTQLVDDGTNPID